MFKKIILILGTLLATSCELPEINRDSDYKIVSANILIDNSESSKSISKELLKQDADVYLLHEAVSGINIDNETFQSEGYSVYNHKESYSNAFNGVLISRIPGVFASLDLVYLHIFDNLISPFYNIDIEINQEKYSFIGAHVPPDIVMGGNVKEIRENSIKDISSYIQGKIKDGYGVLLGGDLNSFPNDSILDPILDAGLDDSVLKNPDKYDKTWSPVEFVPDVARIDYIFHSKKIDVVYQESFEISGSDHKGLVVGVNLK